jgi:hypothetical protein
VAASAGASLAALEQQQRLGDGDKSDSEDGQTEEGLDEYQEFTD